MLVLLAALMHAVWNYLVKAGKDGLLEITGVSLGSALIAGTLLPFVPLPAPASFPWLAITLVLHVGYFASLVFAYRHADLSIAYPLMRGAAPMIVAGVAPAFGETVGICLLSGVLLVATGIVLPAALGWRAGVVASRGVGFAVLNAMLIAGYTLSDGVGVRASGSSLAYTLWLFFLNVWCLLALALWRRRGGVITHLRCHWRRGLAGGALSMGSYGIALWAMTLAPIPAVAALRETSVIFAALLGVTLLGERMGVARVVGSILVACGAALIRWG
jgi:drug/metabolite transporter (DMT)-like permease